MVASWWGCISVVVPHPGLSQPATARWDIEPGFAIASPDLVLSQDASPYRLGRRRFHNLCRAFDGVGEAAKPICKALARIALNDEAKVRFRVGLAHADPASVVFKAVAVNRRTSDLRRKFLRGGQDSLDRG